MIVKKAVELVAPDIRRHVSLIGLGGETLFGPDDNVNFARNFVSVNDPVPKWGRASIWNNPTKADVRTFGNMGVPGSPAWDTNEGYDAHSSVKTYLPYLNDNPRQLIDVPRCRPVP